jgi:hypothetical protein
MLVRVHDRVQVDRNALPAQLEELVQDEGLRQPRKALHEHGDPAWLSLRRRLHLRLGSNGRRLRHRRALAFRP